MGERKGNQSLKTLIFVQRIQGDTPILQGLVGIHVRRSTDEVQKLS